MKFQLMMITVIRMVIMFMMNVKSRYLAMRGILTEVGGRILETSSKNTIRASKMEIHIVIFSPASAGR